MINYDGFNHNEQSIRIVAFLEKKYPNFNGLNLTFETLEGLVKHNGPFFDEKKIPHTIQQIDKIFPIINSFFFNYMIIYTIPFVFPLSMSKIQQGKFNERS